MSTKKNENRKWPEEKQGKQHEQLGNNSPDRFCEIRIWKLECDDFRDSAGFRDLPEYHLKVSAFSEPVLRGRSTDAHLSTLITTYGHGCANDGSKGI